MLDQIIEYYYQDEFIIIPGFDEAVLGIEEESMRIIYSTSKCIEILEKNMSHTEAVEYFNFNICGAYMGKGTPIYCVDEF